MENKNNKGFVGLLILLIATAIIAVISYKYLIQEGDNPVGISEAKKQIDKAKEIANIAEERAKQFESQVGEASDILKNNKLEATIKINSGKETKSYLRVIEKDARVLDLMRALDEDEKDFSFEYKDSSIGAFIEKINGIENNSKTNMYWMFYVNNKLANVGVSEYKIVDGDTIEWRYEDASKAFK